MRSDRSCIVVPLMVSFLLSVSLLASSAEMPGQMSVTPLLRDSIDGVPEKVVVMSRVSIPPNTQLPWHWHPGEEFFYVLEGEITLLQKDLPDLVNRQGDADKVPARAIHTGRSGPSGVTLLITRTLDKDQPERILVNE